MTAPNDPSPPFPYAHARGETGRQCLDAALAACDWAKFPGTLGFLYVTDSLETELEDLLRELRERTQMLDWVGCVGIGICATGQEYLDETAIALMFTDIAPADYRLFGGMDAWSTQAWTLEDGSKPWMAIIHGDPQAGDLMEQVADLAQRTESGFLLGGISSSRNRGAEWAGGRVLHGISGVALSARVPVITRLSQGCTPIGPVHRIEDAQRNIVATLDHRPALEVLYDEVGEVLAKDIRRAAGYIFAALPVMGDDRGDYLVRNLVGVDAEHGMVAIGDYVEAGQELLFCKRDGNSARADLARMLQELLAQKGDRRIRGALYVSCLGRGESLFGPDSAELRQIAEALDQAPLVGFFANGEISGQRVYGYTGVLTLFLESEPDSNRVS